MSRSEVALEATTARIPSVPLTNHTAGCLTQTFRVDSPSMRVNVSIGSSEFVSATRCKHITGPLFNSEWEYSFDAFHRVENSLYTWSDWTCHSAFGVQFHSRRMKEYLNDLKQFEDFTQKINRFRCISLLSGKECSEATLERPFASEGSFTSLLREII